MADNSLSGQNSLSGRIKWGCVVLPVVIAFVAGLNSLGLIDLRLPSDPDKEFAVKALASARDAMKDPTSVMFKDITASAKAKCLKGMILAKNSLGGYTGYQPFVWMDGKTYIDPGELVTGPIIDNINQWGDHATASSKCGTAILNAMEDGPILEIATYPEER